MVSDASSDLCGGRARPVERDIEQVLHPNNPFAPALHFIYRYFETDAPKDVPGAPRSWWFGGGTNLTPSYLLEEDLKLFHSPNVPTEFRTHTVEVALTAAKKATVPVNRKLSLNNLTGNHVIAKLKWFEHEDKLLSIPVLFCFSCIVQEFDLDAGTVSLIRAYAQARVAGDGERRLKRQKQKRNSSGEESRTYAELGGGGRHNAGCYVCFGVHFT